MNVELVLARVRAEFDEMPGMALTVPQAARLFGLDPHVCRVVIERLIDSAHLRWTHTGLVARADGATA